MIELVVNLKHVYCEIIEIITEPALFYCCPARVDTSKQLNRAEILRVQV
jgi:hypothetical protein